jgi:hypothetical protein
VERINLLATVEQAGTRPERRLFRTCGVFQWHGDVLHRRSGNDCRDHLAGRHRLGRVLGEREHDSYPRAEHGAATGSALVLLAIAQQRRRSQRARLER